MVGFGAVWISEGCCFVCVWNSWVMSAMARGVRVRVGVARLDALDDS